MTNNKKPFLLDVSCKNTNCQRDTLNMSLTEGNGGKRQNINEKRGKIYEEQRNPGEKAGKQR